MSVVAYKAASMFTGPNWCTGVVESRKTFSIELEFQENFTIEQIWPDGDAPESPTTQDVIDRINAGNWSVSSFVREWGLDPSVYVNGKATALR